jgi:hypothetical protein
MTDLVIVGDEAWTPEEWEAEQRRRERHNAYHREYQRRPEVRIWSAAYMREWRRQNLVRAREISREASRRRRGTPGTLVGSLHDLACTGPTKATGCRCDKIRCYA